MTLSPVYNSRAVSRPQEVSIELFSGRLLNRHYRGSGPVARRHACPPTRATPRKNPFLLARPTFLITFRVFTSLTRHARVSYTFRAMACDFQRRVVTAGRRSAVCPDTPRTMPEHALLTNYSCFAFLWFLLDARSKFHTSFVSEITSSARVR